MSGIQYLWRNHAHLEIMGPDCDSEKAWSWKLLTFLNLPYRYVDAHSIELMKVFCC